MNNLHIPILTLIDRVNKIQSAYPQANLRDIKDELKLILEEVQTYVKEKEDNNDNI